MASGSLGDKSPRHALVYGASGLSGWATVDQLLSNYPTTGTFSKVTALVNRPLSFQDSFWPEATPDSPELQLVSGANLLSGSVKEFAAWLRKHVKGVESVTHIYYFAMAPYDDTAEEVQGNLAMAKRAIGAIEQISSNLQFVAFPGGARRYGIYLPERPYSAPFKESMPRIEGLEKVNLQIYYYVLEDQLDEMSKGKAWTWCEVNPDAIIGFTPNGSNFSLAAHWALYLSTYALVEGKGAKIPFPGIEACYVSKYNEASAAMIAKMSVWASLTPDKAGARGIYNVADRAEPSSMAERWPAICAYFGLKGMGPDGDGSRLKPGEYVAAHMDVLEKHGLQRKEVFKGHFLDAYGFHFAGDRSFDLSKARNAGFTEEVDPNVAWFRAFDLFRKSGQIPG